MKRDLGPKDLIFPAPVLIVGTYGQDGTPNAMNVAWGGICSSVPPAVAISIRETRRTFANIQAKGAFTVAIATEELMVQADYVGLVSGSKGNKLEKAGLRTVRSEHVDAPVLQDFPVTLECRVMSVTKISQHMHIVGEIVNVLAEESVLNEKGQIDAARLKAIAYDPAGNQYLAASRPVGKAFSAGIPLIK